MKIVVLIKQVPDTWSERRLDPQSGRIVRDPRDAVLDEVSGRALEVALTAKDAVEAEVVVLAMGPDAVTDMLRKALATGADSAVHVLDPGLEDADIAQTACTLAAAIVQEGYDLVIAGAESTDGRGGVVPAMLAELLGVPAATFLASVTIDDGVRGIRRGDDAELIVSASLPAVVSVTEQLPEPRFPTLRGTMGAKRKPLRVVGLAELGVGAADARTVVRTVTERPARNAGVTITDDGTAGAQLADFLRSRDLV